MVVREYIIALCSHFSCLLFLFCLFVVRIAFISTTLIRKILSVSCFRKFSLYFSTFTVFFFFLRLLVFLFPNFLFLAIFLTINIGIATLLCCTFTAKKANARVGQVSNVPTTSKNFEWILQNTKRPVNKGKYNKKLIIAPRKPRVHSSNRGRANDQVMTDFRSLERVYLIVRKISSTLYGF